MTSPGPGGWSPPHTDHMGRVRGGTLVSQKKEGAQVCPLSLQGSHSAVTLGFRNSCCGSGGRHLPAPKMPIRLSLLMSLRVPRKQCLKHVNMDGPLRGHTGRRAGRLSLTSPTLPHRTLGCLPVCLHHTSPWAVFSGAAPLATSQEERHRGSQPCLGPASQAPGL